MKPKAFIYPGDSYVGNNVGKTFEARGYEVLTACNSAVSPSHSCASYQIGAEDASDIEKQFLQMADVVVVELFGHEKAARRLAISLSKQSFGGKLQALIAISDPLVWATTAPQAPLPPPPDGVWDHPYSAPPDQQLLTASAAGPTPDQLPPGTLSDVDVQRRSPCMRAASTLEVETTVLRAARKGRLRSHVVCPGLLYGCGEADAFLHPTFKQCWEVDQGAPEVYGTGANRLPMLHVSDLAQYVAELAVAVPTAPAAPTPRATLTATALGSLASATATQPALASPLSASPSLAVPAGATLGSTAATPGAGAAQGQGFSPAAPSQPPTYCLVVDQGTATQRQVIEAISGYLGTGAVTEVPKEQLLARSGLERFTLDLAFSTTPLPAACNYRPAFGAGFLAHLADVAEQWQAHRNVTPLRVVVLGPPMAGKTALAQRLARRYGLQYVNAKDLVERAKEADPELAKAVAAEMSGKEPRVSPKNMAMLIRHRLASKKTRNRGYVLDALPRAPLTAKWAFMHAARMSAEELAKDEALRAASPSKAPQGKDAGKPGAKGGKDAKAAAAKAQAAPPSEGPEIPPGHKLAPDPAYAPSHVILLEVEEGVLRQRLKAVEGAEIDAAKAALAAAGPPPKGAKEKPLVIPGHNNEREFARRLEAWAKARQEDEEDLAARVAAAEQQWAAKQAELAEQRRKAEAEANTLRARRRRARAEAAAGAGGAGPEAQGSAGEEEQALAGGTAGATQLQVALDSTTVGRSTAVQEGPAGSEAGPQLPKYGGLMGLLIHDCGAKHLSVENNTNDGPEGSVLLHAAPGGSPVKVASVEECTEGLLGEPHNFDGFVADDPPEDHGPLRPESSMVRREREAAEHDAAAREAMASQRASALDAARAAQLQRYGFQSEPLRQWLMSELMPVITEGLVTIVRDRPAAPLRALADRLLQEADRVEEQYIDPYTDPIYEIQAGKIRAKAQREAERADAARAKEDRERATKLKSREAAQQQQLLLQEQDMEQQQSAASTA